MTDYQLKKTPNYLYLIKLSVFMASELCGVAVRGRAIVQKRRVRFRITSGYDFFFGFIFSCVFFLHQHQLFRKGKEILYKQLKLSIFFLLVNVVSHL